MSTPADQLSFDENGHTMEQSHVVKEEAASDIGSVSDAQMFEREQDTDGAKDRLEDPTEPPIVQAPHTNTKDRTLREFLGMMDQYAPIIPDAVTDYYLSQAGFDCEDVRVKRLLALATQKFIADIAQDAYQYSKIRAAGSNAPGTSIPMQPRGRYAKDRSRAVLTMDDLGSAVHEYGISLKRQDFMR